MDAYIQARLDVCNYQNIILAWRGAGLFPFNPQRALCTIIQEGEIPEQEQPKTPTQFDIFDQVFVNSSPLDKATLRSANQLLNLTLDSQVALLTLVYQYIRKLALGTKKLQVQTIVYQHNAINLWSILQKCKTCTNGKRVALKGHFLVSTQDLYDIVVAAKKATKERASKKAKRNGKKKTNKAGVEANDREEAKDESGSENRVCIIVDIK